MKYDKQPFAEYSIGNNSYFPVVILSHSQKTARLNFEPPGFKLLLLQFYLDLFIL